MMTARSAYAAGLEGRIVGDQTVISRAANQNGAVYWVVRRLCGTERSVHMGMLMAGKFRQCLKCAAAKQTGPKSKAWRGGRTVPLTHYNKFLKCARRRKIEWRLSIAELDDLFGAQMGRCVFTGDDLTFDNGARNGVEKGNASLDRKDSSGIYAFGNVQFVTKDINMAKQSLSPEAFVAMCRRVAMWNV